MRIGRKNRKKEKTHHMILNFIKVYEIDSILKQLAPKGLTIPVFSF